MTDIPDEAVKLAAQAIAETFNECAGALSTGEDAGSVAADWMQEARAALKAAASAILAAERERIAEAIEALPQFHQAVDFRTYVPRADVVKLARGESNA